MKLAVPPPFPAANLSSTLSSVKHLDILQMFNESYELSTTASSNTSNATLQWPLTDGVSGSVVATVVSYLMLYGTPAIILVGLIGNTLSLVVYSCTHLERASYSLYMRMLSAVDICFLVALSFVWLHRIGVNLFMSFGWCQMVLYVSHSCGFLSTWSVVNFTMERYINVFHPLRRDMFCTKRRANLIVVSLVVFACLVYTYTIFSYGAVDYGHLSVCSPKPGHRNILQAMTAIDTFVSCVVPSTFIVVCNARLIRKLRHDNVEFSATTAGRDTSGTGPDATADTAAVSHPLAIYHPGSRDVSDTITPKSPKVGIHLSPAEVGSAAISSHSSNTRPSLVTVAGCHRMTRERCRLRKARMLLVLSSILVLLSLPSHVLRTQFTIRHLFGASHRMTRIETDLHEIFQLLYLLGFAVNFFIYSLCGHHFRRELRRTFGRCRYTMCKYKTRALRSRKRSTQNDEIYIQLERVS